MLRATLCRSAAMQGVTPCGLRATSSLYRLSNVSYRSMMTSSSRSNLDTPKAEAVSTSPHQKIAKSKPAELAQAEQVLSKEVVPSEVRGDWVLFHPVYTPEELKSVEVLHREAKTFGDHFAANLVKLARFGFDLVSGYKHKPIPPNHKMTLQELRDNGHLLGPDEWLQRILFLESIAGVPGMCAATIRHLRSLRLMRRDSGWIHTLLEEAENERMHLMHVASFSLTLTTQVNLSLVDTRTFMTIKDPSIFFRAMILGAQGVFYNIFFFSYLFSPSTCHRFVGHLEEEAVLTYTRAIRELEEGRLPEWENIPAPEIAKEYWHLAPDAKMVDVLYAVRSDESTHRFVNHSLANLNPHTDVNPFALREPDMHVKGKVIEFDRSESAEYVKDSHEMMTNAKREAENSS